MGLEIMLEDGRPVPRIVCAVCRRPVLASEGRAVWPPVRFDGRRVEPVFLHVECDRTTARWAPLDEFLRELAAMAGVELRTELAESGERG